MQPAMARGDFGILNARHDLVVVQMWLERFDGRVIGASEFIERVAPRYLILIFQIVQKEAQPVGTIFWERRELSHIIHRLRRNGLWHGPFNARSLKAIYRKRIANFTL